MQIIKPGAFTAAKAWQAIDIDRTDNASIRLHWTDEPYIWHVNDGPEVFVVLDGSVDMHTRINGTESVRTLRVCDKHVAHP